MADPISAIAIGSTIAGGATGAMGSLFGGQAKATMYNYQAGIAQMNAQIAQQNANYARGRGEVEAEQSGFQSRFKIGEAKTMEAAAGIDVNRGSAVGVRTSMANVGSQNEAIIRSNAAIKAYGYEVEGLEDTAQAGLDRMAASTSKTAGTLGAITSILGAGGSVASKWSQGTTAGMKLPGLSWGDLNPFGDNSPWAQQQNQGVVQD